MARPFFLYGSSPDALAAQQQNYERLFTAAAEGNRAAADSANRASLAAFMQARAADDAAREFDARNNFVYFADQQNRADRIRGENEAIRRFDADLAFRQKDLDRRFNRDVAMEDIAMRRIDEQNARNEAKLAASELKFSHERAAADAQAGMIDSAEQVVKRYAGLTPEDGANYFAQSKAARQAIESENDDLINAAGILNQLEKAKADNEAALKAKPTGGFLGMGSNKGELKTAAEKTSAILATLQQQAEAIQNPRSGIMERLKFDPATRTYTPILPSLPWKRSSGGTSTGSSGAQYFAPSGGGDVKPSAGSGRYSVIARGSEPIQPPTAIQPPVAPVAAAPAPFSMPPVAAAPAPAQIPPFFAPIAPAMPSFSGDMRVQPPTPPPSGFGPTAFGSPSIISPEFYNRFDIRELIELLNRASEAITPEYRTELRSLSGATYEPPEPYLRYRRPTELERIREYNYLPTR